MRLPNLIATRKGRLAAFFLLYVTEGIPLGFAATAVATQLRRMGVGPAEIGAFVASFYLPWAFKWAFGPLVDVFAIERWGRRRGWIIVTQILLAATLMSTMLIPLPEKLWLFTVVLLVHNTFGAMQDVAIDALAVNTLHEDERGLANGMMFAGASIGQAVGGSGVLFLAAYTGFQSTFVYVSCSILLVTLFVVLPMREPAGPPRAVLAAGASRLRAALGEMRGFSVAAFRAFLGTRGAYVALLFALLPMSAMALGLALQSNLAVELGFSDEQVAQLNLWSVLVNALFTVIGGKLSDKFGRRRTLAIFTALMAPPTIWLALELQKYGWVMPVDVNAPNRPAVPAALVTAMWIAVIAYNVGNGLMYGTRSALFMDVTDPRVAATQFTAYMALMNLSIAMSAIWQGIAAESIGYPKTLWIDAILGLVCIALLPWIVGTPDNRPDGGASKRARFTALLLGLLCLAWLPYRLSPSALGDARPIVDIGYTVIFVGAALFLLAGAAVLAPREGRTLVRVGVWVAPLLLAMYARRWEAQLPQAAGALFLVVPLIAAALLLALAWRSWGELGEGGTA
jgi:MFS transporter, PAT family, beta-lactamase induction signal transducer AmpG